jgi:hypothetical protein
LPPVVEDLKKVTTFMPLSRAYLTLGSRRHWRP